MKSSRVLGFVWYAVVLLGLAAGLWVPKEAHPAGVGGAYREE
jgi:hypothetical protein